jgi:L-ascorbate metabolism protein UlaG (beta-lactamase superfamily)
MKTILKIFGAVFVLVPVILTAVILFEASDRAVITKYISNENLKTVKPDWKGVPVDEKGRFVNAEFPFLPKTIDLLKWQLGTKPQSAEKKADASRLEVRDPTEFINSERDGILWLGHASVLIRLNGKTVLLDPVFGEPSLFKRFVAVDSPLEKLKQVDYVLLTHDHRDHTDEATIRALAQKFPNAKFLAGLGMEGLLKDWSISAENIQTAGWYQQFETGGDLKITFVPVRHWCRRGLSDTNRRLWGGYVIQGADKTIYHGGDSGYGSHYKEMAEVFPEIDYFVIGIGAYAPRWFMEPNHNNPADAYQAFKDAKAKTLVPMHYGTFDLSDEPPGEPLRLLKEEAEKAVGVDKIMALQINESLNF